ncbi:hypothetical protein TNCV_3159181 [Trichonephila clavipes]|nr:hypothetical protein TNCV_3159181 [Trichonephila clavipes]
MDLVLLSLGGMTRTTSELAPHLQTTLTEGHCVSTTCINPLYTVDPQWHQDLSMRHAGCELVTIIPRLPPSRELPRIVSFLQYYNRQWNSSVVVVANAALVLSTIQVPVRISSAKFPEGMIDGGTTYLHLPNLGMELKGREIFSSPTRLSDSLI